jgi:hypothetical protein
MKDSLLLPVIFLGLLLACFVLFALGYLMYSWDTQFVPANPPTLKWAIAAAPTALRTVFVPATFTALFLVIIRIARRPGIALLSFLLTLVFAAAILFFGPASIDQVLGSADGATLRSYTPLLAGQFNQTNTAVIYPQEVNGETLGPTLLIVQSKGPTFDLASQGSFDPASWSAVFPKRTVPIEPRNPSLSSGLAPRGFLADLFHDISALDAYLRGARDGSLLSFAIALGGVVLFSVSCIAFAWLTRWPVVNVILVAICFRALFWLYSLFSTPVATDAFALVVPKPYMAVAPSLGLGALAVAFMLCNIFFIRPPARQ